MKLGLNKSILVPALVGIGLGYLFNISISNLVAKTGLPIHAMQGMAKRPVHVTPHRVVSHPQAAPHIAPTPHFIPVRRSFDRSYDSWLHNTVNSIPTQG